MREVQEIKKDKVREKHTDVMAQQEQERERKIGEREV